jgi:hypothetical protein
MPAIAESLDGERVETKSQGSRCFEWPSSGAAMLQARVVSNAHAPQSAGERKKIRSAY